VDIIGNVENMASPAPRAPLPRSSAAAERRRDRATVPVEEL